MSTEVEKVDEDFLLDPNEEKSEKETMLLVEIEGKGICMRASVYEKYRQNMNSTATKKR